MTERENIHPYTHLLPRGSKELLLNQRGRVFWFTGLSGSGKSTIARGVEEALHLQGRFVVVLDGDNIRAGINSNLGFSEEDRTENIRRIAEVAKLFCQNGVVTICCFVSPTKVMRQMAERIIGEDDFVEVFIDTPVEECEKRDVKGLYAKARKGEIKDFTGVNAPFEPPQTADIVLRTTGNTVAQTVQQALEQIQPYILRQGNI